MNLKGSGGRAKLSEDMLVYEKKLWKQGWELVAGVDEVGRGPLAGPVVAACVILPKNLLLPGVDDSKKLTRIKREKLFEQIMDHAIEVGIGMVREKTIDRINILNASLKAMWKAVKKLGVSPQFVLVDGNQKIPNLPFPQMPIVKGDSKSICVASASIVAKVTRDKIMHNYHKKYPQFCFAQNKGYSTKSHLEALKTFGPCRIHRRSFKIIKLLETNQMAFGIMES
ncbi:MAG: ribonuclease HII [candidate division Zixibacteria bacterium]|nr:ribonuclease HII [candidate division Zixibacteria bacterium]